MAESTLSKTYADFVRECANFLGIGSVYAVGTVTVAAGVVTLSGGTWPTWAATAAINIAGSLYNVSVRTSGSSITLEDTSVTVASATAYVLLQSQAASEVDDFQQIEDCIAEGLLSVYVPTPQMRPSSDPNQPQKQMPPYRWSFLDVNASLSLTSGDFDYDLPDDCGQVTTGWCYSSGTAGIPLELVDESVIRAKRSQESATGSPKYVAVREKTFDATTGQRFEAIVHPTPSSSLTLDYRYGRVPSKLTPTNKYPLGGALHSATFMASILAAAESRLNGAPGVYAARFAERLASSVQQDMLAAQSSFETYSNTAVTYGTYDWLAQEIGKAKQYGANAKLWTHPQVQDVDTIIQRGYQLFLMPTITGISHQPHRWSFLRPLTSLTLNASYSTGTITVVSGVVTLTSGTFPSWAAYGDVVINGVAYSVNTRDSGTQVTLDDTTVNADAGTAYSLQQTVYELPADFGGIDGPLTYQRGTSIFFPPIEIMAESKLRIVSTAWNSSGQPRYAALRPRSLSNTTGTRWDLVLWPPSDTAYNLFFRYKAIQPGSLATGQYPMGGTVHVETILAACLSLVDPRRAAEFQQKLASSISLDQTEQSPETVGMNYDRSEGGMTSVRNSFPRVRDSDLVRFEGVLYS